jgi:hypothetical protein
LLAKITLVVCVCLLLTAGEAARSIVPPGQIREEKKSTPREEEMTEKRKKEYNKQRRKAIVADAEKILGLAGEIKKGAGSEEDAPPASLLSKLETVEKLARRIKNKMQENANIAQAGNRTARPSRSGL